MSSPDWRAGSRRRGTVLSRHRAAQTRMAIGSMTVLETVASGCLIVIIGAIAILIDWYRADRWPIEVVGIDRTAP